MGYDDITDEDDLEDFEELEEEETPRRNLPRFGPFVTIAAAILILFGAASQVGKTTTEGRFFNLDQAANHALSSAQARRAEELSGVLVTIGAKRVTDAPGSTQGSLRLDERSIPPYRQVPAGTVEDWSQSMVENLDGSAPHLSGLDGRQNPGTDYERFPPVLEAPPQTGSRSKTHVVANGENWIKIEKATGKRWQDIRKANPESNNGLKVGMRLVIPE